MLTKNGKVSLLKSSKLIDWFVNMRDVNVSLRLFMTCI